MQRTTQLLLLSFMPSAITPTVVEECGIFKRLTAIPSLTYTMTPPPPFFLSFR